MRWSPPGRRVRCWFSFLASVGKWSHPSYWLSFLWLGISLSWSFFFLVVFLVCLKQKKHTFCFWKYAKWFWFFWKRIVLHCLNVAMFWPRTNKQKHTQRERWDDDKIIKNREISKRDIFGVSLIFFFFKVLKIAHIRLYIKKGDRKKSGTARNTRLTNRKRLFCFKNLLKYK